MLIFELIKIYFALPNIFAKLKICLFILYVMDIDNNHFNHQLRTMRTTDRRVKTTFLIIFYPFDLTFVVVGVGTTFDPLVELLIVKEPLH